MPQNQNDRRHSLVDRRLRSRGGRRQTDYRRETASGLLCTNCDHGVAQLIEITSSDTDVSLLYRCTVCGHAIVRDGATAGEPR